MTTERTLGPYRLGALLGEGATGRVYDAEDTAARRRVAVKLLRPELWHTGWLADRVRAQAVSPPKLEHRNINALRAILIQDGEAALILDKAVGDPLNRFVERRGRIPLHQLGPMFLGILEAFEFAHGKRFFHANIKPGNFIFSAQAPVQVMDFTLSRILGVSPETAELLSASDYLSPEQLGGAKPDARSDIYSLGIVLYQLATGTLSTPANGARLETLPPQLAAVVLKAAAARPGDRFWNVAEFRTALAPIWGASVLEAPATTTAPEVRVLIDDSVAAEVEPVVLPPPIKITPPPPPVKAAPPPVVRSAPPPVPVAVPPPSSAVAAAAPVLAPEPEPIHLFIDDDNPPSFDPAPVTARPKRAWVRWAALSVGAAGAAAASLLMLRERPAKQAAAPPPEPQPVQSEPVRRQTQASPPREIAALRPPTAPASTTVPANKTSPLSTDASPGMSEAARSAPTTHEAPQLVGPVAAAAAREEPPVEIPVPASVPSPVNPVQLPSGVLPQPEVAPPPEQPQKESAPTPTVLGVDSELQETRRIGGSMPVYPPMARSMRVTGTVHLAVAISPDGRVTDVRAISGHALLIDAAVQAVKTWKYRPTVINGRPVAVRTKLNIVFNAPPSP